MIPLFQRSNSCQLKSADSGRTLRICTKDRAFLIASWKRVTTRMGVEKFAHQVITRISTEKAYLLNDLAKQFDQTPAWLLDESTTSLINFLTNCLRLVSLRPEMLVELCQHAGVTLHKRGLRCFDAEYWLTVKKAIIDGVIAAQKRSLVAAHRATQEAAVKKAWSCFLNFLIMEIKYSFNGEMRRKCSEEVLDNVLDALCDSDDSS